MALIEREILGDQQRLVHKLQLGQGKRNAGKQLGVVIDWRIALGKVEIYVQPVAAQASSSTRRTPSRARSNMSSVNTRRLPATWASPATALQTVPGLQQTKLADTGLVAYQLVHQFALGNQELGSASAASCDSSTGTP